MICQEIFEKGCFSCSRVDYDYISKSLRIGCQLYLYNIIDDVPVLVIIILWVVFSAIGGVVVDKIGL